MPRTPLTIICLLTALLPWYQKTWAADSPTLKVETNCEATGKELVSQKAPTAEACASLCESRTDCEAFTHVSGWGRCFLKHKSPRTHALRFHSGAKQNNGRFHPQGYDLDFPGKDLRLITGIRNWEACADACRAETACLAYGYLEGIASCWLKNGAPGPITKVFSCGLKERQDRKPSP